MLLFYTFIIFIISWLNNRIKKNNAAGCFENELSDEHTTTGRTLQNKTPCWTLVTFFFFFFTGGWRVSAVLHRLQDKPMRPGGGARRWHRPNLTLVFSPTPPGSFFFIPLPLSCCYKTNIKKTETYRLVYVCGASIKSSIFFCFVFSCSFFFFRRRIKLHDEMFPLSCSSPPPLI